MDCNQCTPAMAEEPSPAFVKDRIKLLAIFPKEIWLKMFDSMTPDELEAASNSSPYLRNLLIPRRTEFLFPKVWTNISKLFQGRKLKRSNSSTRDIVGALQKLETYLKRDVLKLRSVCKAWCDGIDTTFQVAMDNFKKSPESTAFSFNSSMDYLSMVSRIESIARNEFDIYCYPGMLNEFMHHFEDTHFPESANRSPFPLANSVSIYFDHEDASFLEQLTKMVLRFGKYIHQLKLGIQDDFPSRGECYAKMHQILSSMPNLESLTLSYTYEGDEGQNVLSREELVDLRAVVDANPLPCFKKLKHLKPANLPTAIFNTLLENNTQICTLATSLRGPNYSYNICSVPLPNLTEFDFNFQSEDQFLEFEQSEMGRGLTTLDLNLRCCPFIPWSRVFETLKNKMGDSLTFLELVTPVASTPEEEITLLEECRTIQLDLPKLKILRLDVKDFSSLNFLMGLKNNLQELQLRILNQEWWETKCQTENRDYEEITNSVEYFSNFSASPNVWTDFPNFQMLKWISVGEDLSEFLFNGPFKVHTRTRTQWNEYVANQ